MALLLLARDAGGINMPPRPSITTVLAVAAVFVQSTLFWRGVEAANCFGPPAESNVNASGGDCADVNVGSSCSFTCEAGYLATGTAECQGDDVWVLSAGDPACVQTCADYDSPSIDFAAINTSTCSAGDGNPIIEGDTCNFTCTDNSSAVLDTTGGDPAVAICSGGELVHLGSAFCGQPCTSNPPVQDLDDVNTTCMGTLHNQTCSFSCGVNYTAAGNASATCMDGEWVEVRTLLIGSPRCLNSPLSVARHLLSVLCRVSEHACREPTLAALVALPSVNGLDFVVWFGWVVDGSVRTFVRACVHVVPYPPRLSRSLSLDSVRALVVVDGLLRLTLHWISGD